MRTISVTDGLCFSGPGEEEHSGGSGDCSAFSVDGRLGKQAGRGEKEAGSELRGMALAFRAFHFGAIGTLSQAILCCSVFVSSPGLCAL